MRAYLNLLKNILSSNFIRLSFPYKLTFAITYKCNYRCKTCNIWQRKPKNEITFDEITEFFRRSNKFNWIDFTGGEVWLRKDFVQIIEVALKYCRNLIMLHFPTNGYMTDLIVRGVESIVKMNPRKLIISVSVDGDEKANDFVRGIKGGWRRQIETYKRLHTIPGVQVFLGMTLSIYNMDQYNKSFAAAKEECPWLTPNDFHLNIAHKSSHYYGNEDNSILPKDVTQLINQMIEYGRLRNKVYNPISYIERQYLRHVKKYLTANLTPMRCHALYSSCFVDPYGDVYPCAMYSTKVAGLREYKFDLQSIWNNPHAIRLQHDIWKYKCPQCWTPCEAYQSILGNLLCHRYT